ncbi:MAG: amidohydrolase [Lachnospiraceae bacterium]|nr:amidohydrolase [Lachnospiraceae bacterium]
MKILIKNVLRLEGEETGKIFRTTSGNIWVDGNRIVSLEKEPEGFTPDKIVDGTGRLAIPGLINAHTHAYMSLFRNYADDMAFWDWLSSVQSVEDGMTRADVYWGTLLNCIEMIKTGTTCFVDMNIKCAEEKTGEESGAAGAVLESGMRAVITRGLIGSVGEEYPDRQIREVLAEKEIFKGEDRIDIWFGPHAPYSCMADNLQRIAELGKEYGTGQTIHLSESESEVANSLKEHGATPIKYVADLGIFDIPTIAAHCVYATDEDIQIMKEHGVSVAMNPKSNMKLGNGFMPAEKFLKAGVNCTLGTDGCGSNNTQNMFAEMNTAALIYKGANKKAQCISAQDVIAFATRNGAKAIGKEGELGEIKEGAKADIVLLDIYEPQFFPSSNLVSALAYSATGAEPETVIIDGRIVMENKEMLTMDVDKVYYQCEKIADRLGMLK